MILEYKRAFFDLQNPAPGHTPEADHFADRAPPSS